MAQKTVLIVDDEQGFIEALRDALEFEGYNVLTATSAEEAICTLQSRKVDIVTIDIMLPPGKSLQAEVSSHKGGLFLCEQVRERFPKVHAFCISVISDDATIRYIQKLGLRFFRKGETPLRTVLAVIRSQLTGLAFTTEGRERDPK